MIHPILHTFKEEIFVPYLAIRNNVEFFREKEDRKVLTKDAVVADVQEVKYLHILSDEAKELVKRLYGIDDVYAFMRKWYNAFPDMDSMEFVYIKLERA